MNPMLIFIAAAAAAVVAGLAGWTAAATRASVALARSATEADRAKSDLLEARDALRMAVDAEAGTRVEAARLAAELDAERRQAAERADAERRLGEAFATVSREALDRNARSFLELAGTRLAQQQAEAKGDLDQRRQAVETLVSPLKDALVRVEAEIAGIEKARQHAYAGLSAQVRGLTETQERLRTETAHLASALRSPQARGRWGEVQLRRVVELAGMVHHCDFVEQSTVERAGTVRRPDLVVTLPGGRRLAVDAKVPLAAYLQAHDTEDDDRRAILLRDHARQLRAHVNALSEKAYWEQFPESPDFVVLFIPGEPFLAAAFEHEAGLFEYAQARRILLATPTTLIALLQSVAVGWRQEAMADNARAVCDVGRELYKRLATMGEHVSAVGKALDRAVEAYNRQVGSLETRVLPSARKLASLEIGDGELAALEPVERTARAPQSPELTLFTSIGDDEVA
jgi:DNA recombination protein RmuC